MLDKTTNSVAKLLTWIFDKLGYLFVFILNKSSEKDHSNLFKYNKLIGFVIFVIIVLIIFLFIKI